MMGQRVLRVEDDRFLRGKGLYVENLELDGALHATFVRSPYAHARIVGVDASAAAELPGTRVFTASDLDLGAFAPPPIPGLDQRMARPYLADGVVRFVGDIVAVVLTETRAEGVDAAELVVVDYEPLPVVVDPAAALAGDVLLFPEPGTNVCTSHPVEADESLFDGCDVVVSGRLVSQRLAACPLETRSCAAVVGDDGRLTMWLTTQTPHQDRDGIARSLGMEASEVRVIAPDVGGGFGAKMLGVEEILVGWLARTTGRPVRWTETRSENMVGMWHGRASHLEFTLGGNRDGKVQAYRLRILQDAGAYPRIGAILPGFTSLMASGVYAIPKIESRVDQRRHEHDSHRPLPRGGTAGGGAGDRAGHGSVCGRARDGSRRGAAPEPLPRRRVPAQDRIRCAVRQRRLRARARPRARDCGLRGAPRGAAPAARIG